MLEIYDSAFISRMDLWEILKIFGASRHACYSIYQKQKKAYIAHLKENDFISPGLNALPNKWITNYLKAIGVTKETIKTQFCRWMQRGGKTREQYVKEAHLFGDKTEEKTK